jgi:hypothetical protein
MDDKHTCYQAKTIFVDPGLSVRSNIKTGIASGNGFFESRIEADLRKVGPAYTGPLDIAELGRRVVLWR